MKKVTYCLLPLWIIALVCSCNSDAPVFEKYRSVVKTIHTAKYVPIDDDYWEKQTFDNQVTITYNGATVALSELPQGIKAEVNGAHLTLSSTIPGVEYIVSGKSGNGSLKINSKQKYKLTLNGVDLTSSSRGVFNSQSLQRVYVETVEGTTNRLCDGVTYEKSELEACKSAFYAEGKLIFSGKGNLTVVGNSKHAIDSEEALLIREDANIAVEKSLSDGIRSTERLVMLGGNISINSSGDALDSKSGKVEILGGNLAISTDGDKGHGLSAGTDVIVLGGNIAISVTGVASKCIKSDSSTYILGGNLALKTTGAAKYDLKDRDLSSSSCIKSSLDLYINDANIATLSSGDAGKGFSCDRFMQIDGGTINIKTTGGYFYNPKDDWDTSSPKGIKSDSTLVINGGKISVIALGECEGSEGIESKSEIIICGSPEIYVCSFDDAINAETIIFNGGKTFAYASNNDAIDANRKLQIHGGLVISNGRGAPEEGLDADFDGNFTLTGGTVISIGGMMGPFPCSPGNAATTQNTLAVGGVQLKKGELLNISTANGESLYSYIIPRDLNYAGIIISTPLFTDGSSFTVSLGGTLKDGNAIGNGLFADGSYSDGKAVGVFEITSVITKMDAEGTVTHEDAIEEGMNGFPPPPGGGMPGGEMPEGGMPQGGPGGPGGPGGMPQMNMDSMFLVMFPGATPPSEELGRAMFEGKITPDSFMHAIYPNGIPEDLPMMGGGFGGGPMGQGGPGGPMGPGGFEKIDENNLPGGGW